MSDNFRNALIGYTGFVGSNLAKDSQYNEFYNSKNILDICGKKFDKVVCAGVNAVKWWANQNPEQDKAQIDHLLSCLMTIKTDVFILISSVDVYQEINGVNEDNIPNPDGLHAYGRHRLYVEEFIKAHFSKYHIIRLPALYGPGLKKNVIFDLMNLNGLDVININSSFQWYPVERLTGDIKVIEQAEIPLINLAVQPVVTKIIIDNNFPTVQVGSKAANEAHYDMRTKYSYLFGKKIPYILDQEEVLSDLHRFVVTEVNK